MRFLFLFCTSVLAINAFSQLNPSREWFTLEGFFHAKRIHNKGIMRIQVRKSEKKDDAIFNEEDHVGTYVFDQQGRLIQSRRFVKLSRRIDTSTYEYVYKDKKLIQRVEKQGAFNFSYNYQWFGDTAIVEIKRDENTLDTNYTHRTAVSKPSQDRLKYTYYNSIGRPMKSIWLKKNLFGQISYRRESYARSISFIADSFDYNATELQKWLKWNNIGKQSKILKEFTYVDGMLDFIQVSKDGQLIAKYALLYNSNELVSSVVIRNVIKKTISVYRLQYEYFVQ